MTISISRLVDGAPSRSTIDDVDAKLAWRASLPGASTYDRAAHAARMLQAKGASAVELLPLVLPTSWMVNAKATSHAMQRWLSPACAPAWSVLLDGIGFGLAPSEWLAMETQQREAIGSAVGELASGDSGATLAAVTKVLALLRPQMVPLMDDAALAYALGLVPMPLTADAPAAPPSAFVPMLDWFAGQVIAAEKELVAIAVAHEHAVLDAAQVLDRLLWIESWGHRLRR